MSEQEHWQSWLREQNFVFDLDIYTRRTYSRDLWPRNLLKDRSTLTPRASTIDGVVWPRSTSEVSRLLAYASQNGWQIYPYGAGSGVCGAGTPDDDDQNSQTRSPRLVLDLKKMDQIIHLDEVSQTLWTEVGHMGQRLEEKLNERGYTLGHFPSSIYCSSLGGYLATRAAGQLSTYYGKIEDMVLASEVVLSDGHVIQTTPAPKLATGPDWNHLFLGSEGTLGIFTKVLLKIHRLPELRIFQAWVAPTLHQAFELVRTWMQMGLRPAVVRIYDEDESRMLHGLSSGCRLITVVEGTHAFAQFTHHEMMVTAEKLGGFIDQGSEPAEHWWSHRYDVSYRQQQILSHRRMILDTFEVSALWGNLEDLYTKVKAVAKKYDLLVILAHFSHFYHNGSNIYFTLCGRADDEANVVAFYDQVWSDLLDACLEARGGISHHHGIGRLKVKAFQAQTESTFRIYRDLKNVLDPKNILNPKNMGL